MLSKIIHLSVDSSNVKWKFYEHLPDKLDTRFDSALIEMGFCGLHVVHDAFQNSHRLARWKVNVTLRSFDKLSDSNGIQTDSHIVCKRT